MTNLIINNSMNVNKNVFSEDNVNIHMTDTLISKQTTININNDNDNENKNDEIMPSNTLNYNNKKVDLDKKPEDNIQVYTFKKDQNNNNITNDLLENNNYHFQIKKEENVNIIQKDKTMDDELIEENKDNIKKIINNNNKAPSSLIIQNNNFSNKIIDNPQRITMTEIYNNEEKNDINKTYNKINKRILKNKDNNYVKAVISINIPGEEKNSSNIVKQFNSLVDRLNGQKSKGKIKNIKKS